MYVYLIILVKIDILFRSFFQSIGLKKISCKVFQICSCVLEKLFCVAAVQRGQKQSNLRTIRMIACVLRFAHLFFSGLMVNINARLSIDRCDQWLWIDWRVIINRLISDCEFHPAWDWTGCEFDSWQCWIYIPCLSSLWLLGSFRGSLGI